MTEKRFEVEKNDKWICIFDNGESIGNVYDVCDMLNHLYEEKQIAIRLAKSNQGKKTRLKNYLKFEYGVSDEKLTEIMTDDKWLGEYDDDGNLVME